MKRFVLPARLQPAGWVLVCFLAGSLALRTGLIGWELALGHPVRNVASILLVGFIHDLVSAAWLVMPFVLLALLCRDTAAGRRAFAILFCSLLIVLMPAVLVITLAELAFWQEFGSRFNFIAVDYLLYTREVLGNIWQSYPVGKLLAAVALVTGATLMTALPRLWRHATGPAGGLGMRMSAALTSVALCVGGSVVVDDSLRAKLPDTQARELAGNGPYEFVRAARNNNLDFHTFYQTLSDERMARELRDEFEESGSPDRFVNKLDPIERDVVGEGPAHERNVVLVSLESLGVDYVESFGGKPGLTPNMDRLAREGMMFTQLYATGLRTVRGLEALTLSVPPTPGHAVPMRRNNHDLPTVGGVFRARGYDTLYLYGGYSRFDNMKSFYEGNGYTVVDRSAIDTKTISHETIWGVADEDLYGLALREIDQRTAAGKLVFAHVMTTTNHRPFTYPDGRIDIPSGSGRDGAVKYADWAIGRFIEQASTRPWFQNTVFVFVADHTSNGRGRSDLPPENYHIPMVIYAPGFIAPTRVDQVASQIDVGPTVLGLLNFSYRSTFFGQNVLTEGRHHQRAFLANYLTVGYLQDNRVVELMPGRKTRVAWATTGKSVDASDTRAPHLVDEAIAYYQWAAERLDEGRINVAAVR